MSRIRLTAAVLLLVLFAWVLPAQAASTGTITVPAEGAVVTSPVRIELEPFQLSNYSLKLEAAHGWNATSGFYEAELGVFMAPNGKSVEYFQWHAEGFNPGPYTLRLSAISASDFKVLKYALCNVVLEGPDYSPKVSLSAHGVLAGQSMISGSAEDADLAAWRLEIHSAGVTQLLAQGTSGNAFPVQVDVADVKDGPYTLRLTAVDRLGQEAVAEQKVQVKNPGPAVQVGLVSVDPVRTAVPVTYEASSAVTVHVDVMGPGGKAVASGDMAGPNRAGTANVPVNFRGLPVGTYAAVATVKDQQGRVGSDAFNILVRDGAQAATLEAPASAEDDYYVRVILPENVEIASMELHVTTAGDTEIQRFPTLPRSQSLSLLEHPRLEGKVGYRVVLHLSDGRVSESEEAVVLVDRQAPKLGRVSVAPIDGQGINLRWEAATDSVGLKGYEVVLIEGTSNRVLASLAPDQLSYVAGLPEGEHQAALVAVDLAGHRSSSDLLTFRVQAGAVSLMRNGAFLPTDTAGFTEEGRTWVPLRLFGEAMGYNVAWDQGKQAATIVDASRGLTMVATVGDTVLQMKGPEGPFTLEIPAAPRLVGSRVLVPLRAMVEAFGAKVKWHGEIWTVELLVD